LAAVADLHRHDGPSVPLLGDERGGRRQVHDRSGRELARRRLGQVAVDREHLCGPLGDPGDEAAITVGPPS